MLLKWEEREGNRVSVGKQRGEVDSAGVDTLTLLESSVSKDPGAMWLSSPVVLKQCPACSTAPSLLSPEGSIALSTGTHTQS